MICHIITGLNDGGAEAVLYRLISHDSPARHHVISLTGPGKYGPLLQERGVPVTCLHMRPDRLSPGAIWRLWRELRRMKPRVVQTWMFHADLLGGIVARLAGCRNVCWSIHHSSFEPGATHRRTILIARISARLSRIIPRRIVVVGNKARDIHADGGYDRDRMEVIWNGIDILEYYPDEQMRVKLRAELRIAHDAAVIGFVARFDPQKDHDNLLRALALLRERGTTPVCLLVGTGMDDRNQTLIKKITELNLKEQIQLLGSRDDIPAVMNAIDLHVMSSSAESFGNVLIEAMACYTPCVTTDVGDAALIVGDTGWTVPPRDPAALAGAIAEALTEVHSPAWQARQTAARSRITDNFSIKRMVSRYREVWASISPPHEN